MNKLHNSKANGLMSFIHEHFGQVARASLAALTLFLINPAIDATARLLSQIKGKPTTLIAENKSRKGEPRKIRDATGKLLSDYEKVELKDGILYIKNIRYGNITKNLEIKLENLKISIMENFGVKEMVNVSREIPPGIIRANLQNHGLGTYLIYEKAVLWLSDEAEMTIASSKDGSKIFLHDGAIYVAPNGSIVATTPTTLLMITPRDVVSATYKGLFEIDINLKNPYISKGKNEDYAELRDETLKAEGGEDVKLEIELSTTKVTPRLIPPTIGAK